MKVNVVFLMLFSVGCSTSGPEVSAPGHIKPHAHHLHRQIPDCFRSVGLDSRGRKCSVRIEERETSLTHRGIPVFMFQGQRVGGVTFGECGGRESRVVIARRGELWSREVLHHEMCHSQDFCDGCHGGSHPPVLGRCCPHWPFIKGVFYRCVSGRVNGSVVHATLLGGNALALADSDKFLLELCVNLNIAGE